MWLIVLLTLNNILSFGQQKLVNKFYKDDKAKKEESELQKSVTKEAKTVDEAIRLACQELETDIDSVDVEIITEGNKGILGIIGNKNAVVKVTPKVTIDDIIVDFLRPIFEKMEITANLEITQKKIKYLFV